MSLALRIMAAIAKAKTSLGDLVKQGTITKITSSTYDPETQAPTNVTSEQVVDGFTAAWEERELDGTNVRSDDVKFYVFPTSVVMTHKDPIRVNDVLYKIVKVSPIKVGAYTGLTMLQLRA